MPQTDRKYGEQKTTTAEGKKEYQKDYMQDYRREQRDIEDEKNLQALLMLDMIQRTEQNKQDLQKMIEDPQYRPSEFVPSKFQPLPKQFSAFLDQVTKHDFEDERQRKHFVLSKFYFGMSRAERAKAAAEALVTIRDKLAEETGQTLKAATECLDSLLCKERLSWRTDKLSEAFVQRLDQFQWCAKHLKEHGFNWYLTSEACGRRFLNTSDFMSYKDMVQRQSGLGYYVPSNKFWELGGRFRNHRFVDTPGDLDWLIEWALSQRAECVQNEALDRQSYQTMYERVQAVKKTELKAYDLFTVEKLSVEQVFERLGTEMDRVLDDFDLRIVIGNIKGKIDQEEKDRIFQDKEVEPVLTEPVTESKPEFKVVKEKVKAIVTDEGEVKK